MSESAARITLSAKGLIMKIVGDVLIIETSDPDELRREVNRALGDEPLTVQGAAGHLKVSTRTIRNWTNPSFSGYRLPSGAHQTRQGCLDRMHIGSVA
jgi:hypothetical protein